MPPSVHPTRPKSKFHFLLFLIFSYAPKSHSILLLLLLSLLSIRTPSLDSVLRIYINGAWYLILPHGLKWLLPQTTAVSLPRRLMQPQKNRLRSIRELVRALLATATALLPVSPRLSSLNTLIHWLPTTHLMISYAGCELSNCGRIPARN